MLRLVVFLLTSKILFILLLRAMNGDLCNYVNLSPLLAFATGDFQYKYLRVFIFDQGGKKKKTTYV